MKSHKNVSFNKVYLILCLTWILTPIVIVSTQENVSIINSYDSLNRLVEVRYPDKIIHYTYDDAGNRTGQTVEILVAAPSITNSSPNSATIGGSAFTLTVNGQNFTNNSIVQWNGANRPTTFVNANQLTASISASDISSIGTAAVTVLDQTTNSVSNTQLFTVQSVAGCVPVSISNSLSAAANSTISVPIPVGNLTDKGVNSYNFILTFNPNVVHPLASAPVDAAGTLSSNFNITTDAATAGQLRVSAFGASVLSGSGSLLKLNFEVVGATGAASDLTWTQFQFNEGNSCATTSNGHITVNCSYSISPTSTNITAASSASTVAVTSSTGCARTAISNNDWLTVITGSTGTGSGTIGYSVAANSGAARTGTITIAGQTFTVNQAATAPTYESDLQNRPNGNGFIDSDDIQQIRRFSVGLDLPYQSNEFQRADSSPRSTLGDGSIDADDIQQARRYSVGLDAKQAAGGQIQRNGLVFEDWKLGTQLAADDSRAKTPLSKTNDVHIENTKSIAGQQVTVPIRVDAQGGEAGFTFSLDYDATKLSNPVVTIGKAGGNVVTNITEGNLNANPIGFSVTSFAGGTIASGTNQLLVTVRFDIGADAAEGDTTITFSDLPARRKVSGTEPNSPLAQPSFTNGTVTIAARTTANVSIGGRILTVDGRGIAGARVYLTNANDDSKIILSNSLGYYRFIDVPVAENYTVTASSKRGYRFTPQIVNVTDNLNEVNIVAKSNLSRQFLP